MNDTDLVKIIRSLHDFGRPASIADISTDIGHALSSNGTPYRTITNIIARHMLDYHGNPSLSTINSGGPAYFRAQEDRHKNQLWLLNKNVVEEKGIDLKPSSLPDSHALSRTQISGSLTTLLDQAGKSRGSGESEDHRALKHFLYKNPGLLGIETDKVSATIEYVLPSADRIDLLIQHDNILTAVEVKSHLSSESDITRGLFQCLKYKALLSALVLLEKRSLSVESVLVVGKEFPGTLKPIQEVLAIKVIDKILVK